MIAAIVIGVLAAVVAVALVVAFFAMKNAADSKFARSGKRSVSSISSVGVSASMPGGSSGAATRVHSDQISSRTPAERMDSRFKGMGVFAGAVFAVLGLKAFTMQVLNGGSYASQADNNRYSTVATPAPRGYICDRDGKTLVGNRSSLTILADPDVVDDPNVVKRLSVTLGVPHNVVRQRIQDSSSGAQSQRVVASDVRQRDVAFIAEHSDAFNGVSIQTRTVREYPYGALGAHVLGYTGTASEDDLSAVREGRTIESGDDVGKSGVEATYDDVLAGEHGQRVVIADADGNVREVVSETQPTKGSDVFLTLAAPLQYQVDKALAKLVAPQDGVIGTGKGVAAAAVVMDVRDGSVLAMGNYPTYSPETFIGGIPQDVWDVYNSVDSHYPMLNRAIAGQYPAASTFKAFTGLAGLQYGFATDKASWKCTGSWDGFNSGDVQKCWDHAGHGVLDFHGGIVNSCDIVFYDIGKNFWDAGTSQGGNIPDTAMQDEIAKYRFGELTGIDLAGEEAGRIPSAKWKAEHYRDVPEEAVWRGGDLTNMAIGQGDVLISPLQLAVAYGGIATGKLMKPHLLKEVRNSQGDVVVSFEPEVVAEPDVQEQHLKTVREALHGVATENEAVAALFSRYGIDAAAKTGTAEVQGKGDYAWFACYAPYEDPKYVVTCVVEQGGGGSAVAAPLGSKIMNYALQYDKGKLKDVKSVAASSGTSVAADPSSSSGRMD
ncbi:MAG: penicillin-binding protein 2 [Coriobacteriia bacterium]|nr:penicillin-binding protein 2 [Coriobacteriia bacterium]